MSKWWLHPPQWRLIWIKHKLCHRLQERVEMGQNR
jgi:hypothetical protein